MSGKRCTGVTHHSCARQLNHKTPVAMLYLLAEHARDDGYAWPGQERIGELMNMSVKQVRRTINKLEAMGDLIVKRNRGKGNSNEYLVTPGLSDEQICEALTAYNMFPDPMQVVQQMHAKRVTAVSSFFAQQKGTSETQKGTSENRKRGHSRPKKSQKGTFDNTKGDTAMTPEPSSLEPSNSEPSEREPSGGQLALEPNNTVNKLAKEDKKPSTFKAKKTTTASDAKTKTPPNSAPPPPTYFQSTVEALYEACSKRASRRNRVKFAEAARVLHADGFNATQILLTRRWWDQVGMGSRGATAPHPSQIIECIEEAQAWQAKQTAPGQPNHISNSSSDQYTEEEAAILQAQLAEAGLI